MNNDLVCFIPARRNSKSIPEKNTKLLGGKPLVAWSIETAKNCGLERIVVNTDDPKIAEIASRYGVEAQMRPLNLGWDDTPMFDVLRSEIFKLSPVPDHVLLLQPTSPFRNKNQVNIALGYFLANLEKYDSLVSVERVPEKYHPYAMILESSSGKRMLFRKLIGWKEKLFSKQKFVGPLLSGFPISTRIMRRQDLPQCWIPDGSIYLFRADNLKQGSLYGKQTMLLETEVTRNLNTLEELEEVEKLCAQK